MLHDFIQHMIDITIVKRYIEDIFQCAKTLKINNECKK